MGPRGRLTWTSVMCTSVKRQETQEGAARVRAGRQQRRGVCAKWPPQGLCLPPCLVPSGCLKGALRQGWSHILSLCLQRGFLPGQGSCLPSMELGPMRSVFGGGSLPGSDTLHEGARHLYSTVGGRFSRGPIFQKLGFVACDPNVCAGLSQVLESVASV